MSGSITGLRLFPDAASTTAHRADALFFFLCAISAFMTLLIFLLVVYFGLRYRRRGNVPPPPTHASHAVEAIWTIIPLGIFMVMFTWGARVYFYNYNVPANALEIHVIGKQWMWKIQHPNGRREINSLHVPINRPIKLIMGSQDVIHSFFIPAFRTKQDVVPGRFTVQWFEPTKLGTFHLFCAEYCGTEHSGMVGTVTVMEPEKYEAWLASTPPGQSPSEVGAALFQELGCIACHGQIGPSLSGLYMKKVELDNGQTVTANDDYLRESILDSTARIVKGYAPIMPSYRGELSEEQLMALVSYIKSLKDVQTQKKVQ